MIKETQETETKLPYNADTDVLKKILDDLKNTGNEGVHQKTLWANIDEATNTNKSYTLNLAKFLKLIDMDSTKVWLTQLGRSIGYISGEKRNKLLAQNMPEMYMTMFKWIKYSEGEMFANDIKVKFINTYGNLSPAILDKAIATFLNYCQFIGILTYSGKGRGAKAILTDFGKKVLDLPAEDTKTEPIKEELPKNELNLELSKEATYPVKIITRDRTFDWDIKSDADLTVIDSVVNSIKENWKAKKEVKQKHI